MNGNQGRHLALVTVTNKQGLDVFAPFLKDRNWDLLTSGGTGKFLVSEAHVEVIEISGWLARAFVHQVGVAEIGDPTLSAEEMLAKVPQYLPFGTMLNGWIKTLSREVAAALLGQLIEADINQLRLLGIRPVEMLVANFYGLDAATKAADATINSVIEKMDIGGPVATLQAIKAGKMVIIDPADYPIVMKEMESSPSITPELRAYLRLKAVKMVADYYGPLADFLERPAK
jgi:phosphoribosylaminoimidazolecarboxamide formyltransferase/IMP cyclohydrolase